MVPNQWIQGNICMCHYRLFFKKLKSVLLTQVTDSLLHFQLKFFGLQLWSSLVYFKGSSHIWKSKDASKYPQEMPQISTCEFYDAGACMT